jgi:hypothetical protein
MARAKISAIQVHRFASPELSAPIKEIWTSGLENPELRELTFELIAAGKLTGCADIAYSVAVDPKALHRERRHALEALIALNDDRLFEIGASIESDTVLWPPDLTRSAILRLFPRNFSVPQLSNVLRRVQEPPRTIGDVSWKLPQLIAEEALTPDALDQLRVGLTELVLERAEWRNDKWPHTRTKRPDLVTSLLAVCIRQFSEGVTTAELFRSSVLALRFTKQDDVQDEPTKVLRTFLANASSGKREAAFWADDAFMQALHPVRDAWGRVSHLSHYGGIRLDPDKDWDWVIRRLSDKAIALPEREMMLYAAMIELWRPGGDVTTVLEGLKAYVADAPPLLVIIENRLKPDPGSEELRRLEQEHARHQREAQRRDAKARASWIEFWGEIAANPDAAFEESRADNTAWNLWQAMERSGSESRASGWNRRFIEQQFGRDVANRLRVALQRIWRKFKPTLRSERPADKKGTFLVKWQLGLAAIYAEAEDDQWATKLTAEEARLATRYVPIELSGFPSWLEALATAHPEAVDAVLGAELSCTLRESSEDVNAASCLQDVRHASPKVATLFIPRIKDWFDDVCSGCVNGAAASAERIGQAVDVLMQSDDPAIRKTLAGAAARELSKGLESTSAKVWLPVLMQIDPEAGVDALERGLDTIAPSRYGPAIAWFSLLFDEDRHRATVDLRRAQFTPKLLLRLVRLAFRHVRPMDDTDHEESLNERDHAERGRAAILNALLATTGSSGWAAKLEMAADPLFAHFRDRAIAIARERAAEDADGVALSEADVVALDTYGEAPPTTRDAMFAIMRDRLDDIDDLLLQDVSPREAWANIQDERLMRRELARELRNSANRMYTVDQEGVTADEKETDIRMRATRSPQQATIELKIGEKLRSAQQLRDGIKSQLLAKYMAADERRAGCLVVTIRSDKTWSHPDTRKRLDFPDLIAMLNEESNRLSQELGGTTRLAAKGLDLRPRLRTERKTSAKEKSSREAKAKPKRAKASKSALRRRTVKSRKAKSGRAPAGGGR